MREGAGADRIGRGDDVPDQGRSRYLEEKHHCQALARVVHEVCQNADLDDLIEAVTGILGEGMAVSRAMIGLYGPSIATYSFQSIWHSDAAPRFDRIVMQGQERNPSFRLLLTGQSYCCADTETDPRIVVQRGFYRKYKIRASMFAGLWREGSWWGAIGVHECRSPRTWTAGEQTLLELAADQVALGIDLIRYRERAQEQAAELAENVVHGSDAKAPAKETGRDCTVTEGEAKVLRRLARGETNSEIAAALNLSRRTVESHITNMLGKLALRNRVELARFALEHGIR